MCAVVVVLHDADACAVVVVGPAVDVVVVVNTDLRHSVVVVYVGGERDQVVGPGVAVDLKY